MKRWIPVVMVLALLMSQPGARIASAQSDSVWLAVSPVDITVEIDPGQSVEKAVTVTNKGAAQALLRISTPVLALAKTTDGKYRFDVDPKGETRGLNVAAGSLESIPGSAAREIKVQLAAERNAEPGSYYRGVMVESFDPNAPNTAQVLRFRAE